MPGLTVTEKNHWKDRISQKIDRRIESLTASDPTLLERVKAQARQIALESLGLADLQAALTACDREEEALELRQKQLHRQILARLRGVPVESIDQEYYYYETELERAVERRADAHEQELLRTTPLGQQVLAMRTEKDNLLDTVWLATSPAQVKQLWTKVAELLGDTPSPLEREALAIVPPTE